MTKTILALVVVLFSSNISATERIYIDTRYNNANEKPVLRNLACRDSQCAIQSRLGEGSITLSDAQRDRILKAFQTELNRFDINPHPNPGDQSVRIKLKYTTDRKRLEITRNLSIEQLADVSPELAAVIKTFLGEDLSNLQLADTAAKEEKPIATPAQQF